MTPVLQAQDGSFVGEVVTAYDDNGNPSEYDMVAFDQSGAVRWIVAQDRPYIATDDGGVIGQSGITYDQNGRDWDHDNLPTYSWPLNAYRVGSVERWSRSMLPDLPRVGGHSEWQTRLATTPQRSNLGMRRSRAVRVRRFHALRRLLRRR